MIKTIFLHKIMTDFTLVLLEISDRLNFFRIEYVMLQYNSISFVHVRFLQSILIHLAVCVNFRGRRMIFRKWTT